MLIPRHRQLSHVHLLMEKGTDGPATLSVSSSLSALHVFVHSLQWIHGHIKHKNLIMA